MQIAQYSIRSFANHFSQSHSLTIHTDNSIGSQDQQLLLKAAGGMQVNLVSSEQRKDSLKSRLAAYPLIRDLTDRNSFFTKLEIPMTQEVPFFYFDSDVIWLRHVSNLNPPHAPNAFSTETWTFYPGMAHIGYWIKNKIPHRVNSGFFYVNEPFPFEELENLLANGFYDKNAQNAGDQEIFAFLYKKMETYHTGDMKRSRVGSIYNLREVPCAALHFCGGMWKSHLEQVRQLQDCKSGEPMMVRYQSPVALSRLELYRTNTGLKIGNSRLLTKPLNIVRRGLRRFR